MTVHLYFSLIPEALIASMLLLAASFVVLWVINGLTARKAPL